MQLRSVSGCCAVQWERCTASPGWTKHMGHCSLWVCAGHCEDGAEQQAWDPEGNLPTSAMSHVKGKCWGNTEAAVVLFHSVFLVRQNKELILGDEA